MKKITIAIDGFSSCGKSTMAKDLAREIGYIYIDSGAMYRAVTLYSIENGIFQGNHMGTLVFFLAGTVLSLVLTMMIKEASLKERRIE